MTTTTYEAADNNVNLRPIKELSTRLLYPFIGLFGLISIWWFGGHLIESDPDLAFLTSTITYFLCINRPR